MGTKARYVSIGFLVGAIAVGILHALGSSSAPARAPIERPSPEGETAPRAGVESPPARGTEAARQALGAASDDVVPVSADPGSLLVEQLRSRRKELTHVEDELARARAARRGREERKPDAREQELQARQRELSVAARAARRDIHRWLAADASRPLEFYRQLRDGNEEGTSREGHLLADFFDNGPLEAEVLADLTSAPEPRVRRLALEVVEARPSRARVEAVMGTAAGDEREEVRVKALAVLTSYRDDPLAIRQRRAIRDGLVAAAVNVEAPRARVQAVVGLSCDQHPTTEIIELFQNLIEEDPDRTVQVVASQALRRWGASQGKE